MYKNKDSMEWIDINVSRPKDHWIIAVKGDSTVHGNKTILCGSFNNGQFFEQFCECNKEVQNITHWNPHFWVREFY